MPRITKARGTAVSKARGTAAILARYRNPDDPDLLDAKRDLATAKIEAYIAKTLADAPPLSDDQLATLTRVLAPADGWTIARRQDVEAQPADSGGNIAA